MKAIIVGGGVMGLSTAWALAREGHDVELFEQAELPNPLASSMDEHRLIRHPYGDHIGYARMIDDAYAAWDLMWRDLGQRLYAPTGTLALTGNGADWAERSAATLAAIGRPMTELPVAELPRRFPLLDARGVERAFWIDTGGVLFAQDIVAALVRYLTQHPRVRLHAATPVRSVDLEQGRVVTADGAPSRRRRRDRRGRRLGRPAVAGARPAPRAVAPDRHLFPSAGRPARGLGQGPDDHREDRRCRPLSRAAHGRPRLQGRRPRIQPPRRSGGRALGERGRDPSAARALPQPVPRLRALAHRPAEGVLLHGDR